MFEGSKNVEVRDIAERYQEEDDEVAQTKPTTNAHYWVVQQGDLLTIVQSDGVPDLAPVPGERMKRANGPYETQALADAALERLYARTLPGMIESGVM